MDGKIPPRLAIVQDSPVAVALSPENYLLFLKDCLGF